MPKSAVAGAGMFDRVSGRVRAATGLQAVSDVVLFAKCVLSPAQGDYFLIYSNNAPTPNKKEECSIYPNYGRI